MTQLLAGLGRIVRPWAVEPGADPLDALLEQKLAPLAPDIRAQIRKRIDDAIANAPPGTDNNGRRNPDPLLVGKV